MSAAAMHPYSSRYHAAKGWRPSVLVCWCSRARDYSSEVEGIFEVCISQRAFVHFGEVRHVLHQAAYHVGKRQ